MRFVTYVISKLCLVYAYLHIQTMYHATVDRVPHVSYRLLLFSTQPCSIADVRREKVKEYRRSSIRDNLSSFSFFLII